MAEPQPITQSPRSISDNMDHIIDTLILSHLLISYNANSLANINANNIQNPLERSMLELLRNEELNEINIPNMEVQVICLETAEELIAPFECDICYESRPTIDKITTNCQHHMCKTCAKQCLKNIAKCPFCRQCVTIIEVKDVELVDSF